MNTYLIQLQGQVDVNELNLMSPHQMVLVCTDPAGTQVSIYTDQSGLIGLMRHLPKSHHARVKALRAKGIHDVTVSEPSSTRRAVTMISSMASDPRVAEALEEVAALAVRVVVLGSYEAWVEGSRLSAPPPTPARATPCGPRPASSSTS